MLTWLFHEYSFRVVLLESLLMLHGKPDMESREVYPGPPPKYMAVGALVGSFRDSVKLAFNSFGYMDCYVGLTEVPEEKINVKLGFSVFNLLLYQSREMYVATPGFDALGGFAD